MTPTPRSSKPAPSAIDDAAKRAEPADPAAPANSRFRLAEDAFHAVLKQEPADREDFIVTACLGDESLQEEVKRLLAAHGKAASYFENPVSPEVANELARFKPEEPGDKIGPYKLLEKIGEGGFGIVWVAEQSHPVRRRVALKIIKVGMDTREVVARFEQERQALAMMDHSNIAKVFDAGTTPTGRPYFVMELVRGLKLTEYCDQQQLPTEQRIELFIHVCQAVQHAHQKGIIHRDLKPSNILVTINDGAAVPKVIDFGVAKATQGRLSDLTVYTQFEQMIGTPLYMSPEQAEMTSLDIDTRSDIYSLGVLLYELLTGHTPIAEDTLRRAGMDELRRVIREVDPVRPSMRIKAMEHVELTTAAKRRQVEPRKLTTQLRGDLDWIAMKCLEKDRKRRYDTANGLAQDLRRHLNNELITARAPTTRYLISRLVRRHKFGFAAGAAIATSTVIGFGIATWMFFKERSARQRAVAAEKEQSSLRVTAEANERRAAREGIKSKQVARFLQDMLKGVGPANARGKDPGMLQQILAETDNRLSKDLQDQPAVEAAIRSTLAQVYYDLGDYDKAIVILRRALELYDANGKDQYAREISRVQTDLGVALAETGRMTEAKKLLDEGLAMARTLYPEPTADLAHALHGAGTVAWYTGDFMMGETCLKEEVSTYEKLGLQDDPEYGRALNDLGWQVLARGGAEDSESYSKRALNLWDKLYGENHPYHQYSFGNLALAKWYQGKLTEAEEMVRKELELHKKLVGENHPEFAAAENNLSNILRDLERFDEAEHNSREALASTAKARGETHLYTLLIKKNLSTILRRKGAAIGDTGPVIESLRTNPTEPLTMETLATLCLRPKLTRLAAGEQVNESAWAYTRAFPSGAWWAREFDDSGWQRSPPPVGALSFYPRTPKTSFKGRSGLWLRRGFTLAAAPTEPVWLTVAKYHDARIYLNGVQVAPMADWCDTEFLLPCSIAAQGTLKPGPNSMAVYCEDADRGATIEVRLWQGPNIAGLWRPVITEVDRLLNMEPRRAELYGARANCFAREGNWEAAQSSLAKSAELQPQNWPLRTSLALVNLTKGDALKYKEQCKTLLKEFREFERVDAVQDISFVSLLAPGDPSELEAAQRLSAQVRNLDYGDAGLPARQLTKALADLRSGRFAESIAGCERVRSSTADKSLPGWTHEGERNRTVAAFAITAMAESAMSRTSAAADTIRNATQYTESELPKPLGEDAGREWPGLLAARILMQQAQAEISRKVAK